MVSTHDTQGVTRPHLLATILPSEAATDRFAQDLAAAVMPGDLIAFEGDLGAGKTTLCRAIIRQLIGDPQHIVPSPTFAIMQPYDGRIPIRHFDLYRLTDPDELYEIGFFEGLDETLNLVEWPGHGDGVLPTPDLVVSMTVAGETERRLCVTAGPISGRDQGDVDGWDQSLENRFARSQALRKFLIKADLGEAQRVHVQGDASHRAYERITHAGKTSILMNAPKTPAGDILKNGKTYAETVHRAPDTKAFETIATALTSLGFSAPAIHAHDRMNGFMLLEDLGRDSFLSADGKPILERYQTAIAALALLHHKAPAIAPDIAPPFDLQAFLAEVELFPAHFAPHCGITLSPSALSDYEAIWRALFTNLADAEPGLILRDVHTPNLLWLNTRRDHRKVGFLDFQDALWGPQVYDIASLIYDARVTIDSQFQDTLFTCYCRCRAAYQSGNAWYGTNASLSEYIPFYGKQYNTHIKILAAQRISKVLGIFARLVNHDAKPSYLMHMPRNMEYLLQLLKDPILSPLRDWHQRHLPDNQVTARIRHP